MRCHTIHLQQSMFDEVERVFLTSSDFQVSLVRYSSRVCAVKITNFIITLIVLPFQGQQVWRFDCTKRHLTMKSIFDEPEDTSQFGLNYGGFLIHCGLTATGNPSTNDSHPLHGELPNARYQSAYIRIGEDNNGEFITLGGTFTYRNSLEYYYTFEPELKLYANSSVVDVNTTAKNLRSKPMKYMYMAHINWLPVDDSRLVYSIVPGSTEVFNDTFGLPTHDQMRFRHFVETIKQKPDIADFIDPRTQIYDPELCMFMQVAPDAQGYAHAMQVFPEGDAGYISFRTRELPNAVRWYARTGDEDALAFSIPSTNNHLGFSRNDAKGLISEIPAKDSCKMHYRFGYLPKKQAMDVEVAIKEIVNGAVELTRNE